MGRLHHTSQGCFLTFPPEGGALEGTLAHFVHQSDQPRWKIELRGSVWGRLAGYMDTVAGQIS